jgi:hypothetical protein
MATAVDLATLASLAMKDSNSAHFVSVSGLLRPALEMRLVIPPSARWAPRKCHLPNSSPAPTT